MPDEPPYDAAYQGTAGAYSEDAALTFVGPGARLLPCPSLADVFAALAEGRARHAVVPVENTLSGAVPTAYELLVAHDGRAVDEVVVPIDHVLAARSGLTLDSIRRVLSHPVALAQCAGFFRAHPAIEPVPVFDTAGAVPLALAATGPNTAAIASRRAAALHGATILAERLQDHAENWTRFLLLAPRGAHTHEGTPGPQKAVVTFQLPHEPGALAAALAPLAAHGVNLTKIESRPIAGRPFEYFFVIEALALRGDLEAALGELEGRTTRLSVLGIYAAKPQARSASGYDTVAG